MSFTLCCVAICWACLVDNRRGSGTLLYPYIREADYLPDRRLSGRVEKLRYHGVHADDRQYMRRTAILYTAALLLFYQTSFDRFSSVDEFAGNAGGFYLLGSREHDDEPRSHPDRELGL